MLPKVQANIMLDVTQIILAQSLQNRLREAKNLKVQSITTLSQCCQRALQIPYRGLMN